MPQISSLIQRAACPLDNQLRLFETRIVNYPGSIFFALDLIKSLLRDVIIWWVHLEGILSLFFPPLCYFLFTPTLPANQFNVQETLQVFKGVGKYSRRCWKFATLSEDKSTVFNPKALCSVFSFSVQVPTYIFGCLYCLHFNEKILLRIFF